MNEDYKKIALEDVKKGQRIRVVEQYPSHIATYEGIVFRANPEWSEIDLGEEGGETTVFIGTIADTDILLLEDVPKPKVVRTETVTITHYDDGTKTETPVKEVWVPMVIKTMDQFEEYLKNTRLRDKDGDSWTCRNGRWCFHPQADAPLGDWTPTPAEGFIKACLPLTVVETLGD